MNAYQFSDSKLLEKFEEYLAKLQQENYTEKQVHEYNHICQVIEDKKFTIKRGRK